MKARVAFGAKGTKCTACERRADHTAIEGVFLDVPMLGIEGVVLVKFFCGTCSRVIAAALGLGEYEEPPAASQIDPSGTPGGEDDER